MAGFVRLAKVVAERFQAQLPAGPIDQEQYEEALCGLKKLVRSLCKRLVDCLEFGLGVASGTLDQNLPAAFQQDGIRTFLTRTESFSDHIFVTPSVDHGGVVPGEIQQDRRHHDVVLRFCRAQSTEFANGPKATPGEDKAGSLWRFRKTRFGSPDRKSGV